LDCKIAAPWNEANDWRVILIRALSWTFRRPERLMLAPLEVVTEVEWRSDSTDEVAKNDAPAVRVMDEFCTSVMGEFCAAKSEAESRLNELDWARVMEPELMTEAPLSNMTEAVSVSAREVV